MRLDELKIKIFADGANLTTIKELAQDPLIKGFTTNPTLMRRAGVTNYEQFAKEALAVIGDRPISFEVIADEPDEIWRQAHLINSWGANVYIKIPIIRTNGESNRPLIRDLSCFMKLNVTAIMTEQQIAIAINSLDGGQPSFISVFAGRIADTLTIPRRLMFIIGNNPMEFIWASSREVRNILDAQAAGFDIITITPDLYYQKFKLIGKDLEQYSLETVREFYNDAQASGLTL